MKRCRGILMGIVLMAIMMVLMPVSSVSADEGDVYTISYEKLTNISTSSMVTSISAGSKLSMVFTADDGYELPDTITILVNGNEMTDGYRYEGDTLVIYEVYGNIEIIAAGKSVEDSSSETYDIVYDLYKVNASKQDGKVSAGTEYSVKLTPESGYKLKNTNIGVSVNGADVTSGYSYNDGVLTITSVEGDIVITAVGTPKSSSDKKDDEKDNSSSNKSNNSNKNNNSSTSSTSGGSSNSKSAQALKTSGGSASNYNSGSYSAPRTGDNGPDNRFLGVAVLLCVGVGCILLGRKRTNTDKNAN